MKFMGASQEDAAVLFERAVRGDQQAWGALLEQHRDRLRRLIALRLDARLQGRVDASDVIQEAYLEASTRLPDYAQSPDLPFFLWLRYLVGQKIIDQHRRHLGAQARDAGREVAGPSAYPHPSRMETGRRFRAPVAWELELLEACLQTARALPGVQEGGIEADGK
jgi:RNA polymerase sigma-70 factor (ECF subfamily)